MAELNRRAGQKRTVWQRANGFLCFGMRRLSVMVLEGGFEMRGDTREPNSPYPYHFGPMSHYIVTPPLVNGPVDYFVRTKDMDLNRWSEQHVYYTIQDRKSTRLNSSHAN